MISDAIRKWTVVLVILMSAVDSQMPMMQMPMPYPYGPMMMPGPPPPPPMPMPVPFPVPIPIPYEEEKPETTTTTSTTPPTRDIRFPIGIPVPVPRFVQIAVPGFLPPNCEKNGKNDGKKNNNCPPCPPCTCNPCTPSFFAFCSPCHLQCRCKNGKENPSPQPPKPPMPIPGPAFPMPIPLPAPPPIVMIPFPPQFDNGRRPNHSGCESRTPVSQSCSGERHDKTCESHGTCDCDERSSCESSRYEDSSRNTKKKRKRNRNKRRRKKNSRYDIYRRNLALKKGDHGDNGLVKPVLTYMSRNGKIKMKRRLSNDEANALLGEGDSIQNVHLMTGEDSNNRQRVIVRSNHGRRNGIRRRHLILREGMLDHELTEGRKELVFRPPDNKKISNLSVSFQIAR